MPSTQTFTLPAGTICWRGGMPFMLMNATLTECHPDNWPLIRDGFQPEASVSCAEFTDFSTVGLFDEEVA